ncbi:MAG: hypothetical protein ACYCTF_01710 [Acidiferrobacter sp.]
MRQPAIIWSVRVRTLKNVITPLILVFWLVALWACMAPQGHHRSHDGKACAVVHNAIGPQTVSKIVGTPAPLPMVLAVFLAIDMILVSFSRTVTTTVPLLQRRRHRPAQPNAPPSLAFIL